MVAALKSEWVAAFKSEYPAGFIGIRSLCRTVAVVTVPLCDIERAAAEHKETPH